MNLYAIFSTLFVYLCKVASNEKKVNPIDLIFIINAMNVPISALIILTTSLSFVVPKESRNVFSSRVILGWFLVLVYVIGNTLVPLTVQQTLTNTTPFWASILGYFVANEKLSCF